MTSSEDKDREVWGRYLAAYREAHPNAGIPGACLTIDALRVFERNARSSCADTVATPEEWTAISRLLNVAQKATFAMEDSEETGEGHIVPNEQAVELSAALDALEELPAAPGYASGARSNAAYALRRLLHPKASAAPESETPKLRTCAKCGLKASHVADCTADGCPMLEPSASSASAALVAEAGPLEGLRERLVKLERERDGGWSPDARSALAEAVAIARMLQPAPVSSTTEPEGYPGIAADCETMREALLMIAGEIPCADNLLGNSDIAQIALEKLTRSATGETK